MLTLTLRCSLSLTRMRVLQILMAVNAMFLVRSDNEAATVPVGRLPRRCPMLHVLSARLLILCAT